MEKTKVREEGARENEGKRIRPNDNKIKYLEKQMRNNKNFNWEKKNWVEEVEVIDLETPYEDLKFFTYYLIF